MPSYSGSLLGCYLPVAAMPTPERSVPQRLKERMRPTEPMAQPHIHQRFIENDPGSDYSIVSCVPHICGVQIHGYEEKRVD